MPETHTNGLDQKIIAMYKAEGRQPTKKEFKLSDSRLYALLGRHKVRLKNGTMSTSHTREHKADPKPRAKRRTPPNHIRDALVYLGKAQDRAMDQANDGVEDALLILGLIALAIEALGG